MTTMLGFDARTTTDPGVVRRPNGNLYRRRKSPVAVEVESYYDCCTTQYLVLRTHDIAEAEALVPPDLREGCTPALEWVRESICMCGGGHARDYTNDPARGVPCVAFRPDWENQ